MTLNLIKNKVYTILIVLLCCAVQGCTMADLRTSSLRQDGLTQESQNKGQRLLQLATWRQDKTSQWERFDRWHIVTRDVWKSQLIRKFTPIKEADQKLKFSFAINGQKLKMEFLDGKQIGDVMGVEDGQTFKIIDGKRFEKDDRKTELYLPPVRDYFFWPQSLVNAETIVYAGEQVHEGMLYHKVFVTEGSLQPQENTDQYLVWINQETMRIDYIQFTLRDMLKSYAGVVEYGDYRGVQDMVLPFQIRLKDKIGQEKYSHEFLVENMSFEKDIPEMTFSINIKPYSSVWEKFGGE